MFTLEEIKSMGGRFKKALIDHMLDEDTKNRKYTQEKLKEAHNEQHLQAIMRKELEEDIEYVQSIMDDISDCMFRSVE